MHNAVITMLFVLCSSVVLLKDNEHTYIYVNASNVKIWQTFPKLNAMLMITRSNSSESQHGSQRLRRESSGWMRMKGGGIIIYLFVWSWLKLWPRVETCKNAQRRPRIELWLRAGQGWWPNDIFCRLHRMTITCSDDALLCCIYHDSIV